MKITNTSKILLKNSHLFTKRHIIFSGCIQDIFFNKLTTKSTIIHLFNYHYYKLFNNFFKKNLFFQLMLKKKITKKIDSLVYFWPKDKKNAIFQLLNLISYIPNVNEIFVVGANNSGIKSANTLLKKWIILKKIDNARKCILMHGVIIVKPQFKLLDFFNIYIWKNFLIKTLPGVFGYKFVDYGSSLLISTFKNNKKEKILDIGCGSGILSVAIAKNSVKKTNLTLIDINIESIISSKETLKANKIKGTVLVSDLYSRINQKFELIISNPPFHDNLILNKTFINNLIKNSKKYLLPKGELRIVVSSFLLYNKYIKKIYGNCNILKKENNYHVYQSFYHCNNTRSGT